MIIISGVHSWRLIVSIQTNFSSRVIFAQKYKTVSYSRVCYSCMNQYFNTFSTRSLKMFRTEKSVNKKKLNSASKDLNL